MKWQVVMCDEEKYGWGTSWRMMREEDEVFHVKALRVWRQCSPEGTQLKIVGKGFPGEGDRKGAGSEVGRNKPDVFRRWTECKHQKRWVKEGVVGNIAGEARRGQTMSGSAGHRKDLRPKAKCEENECEGGKGSDLLFVKIPRTGYVESGQ